MKTNRILWLGVVTLCGLMAAPTLTFGAEREGRGRPGGQAERRERGQNAPGRGQYFQRMAEQLNLTDAQKEKIQALFREQMEQFRKLREDSSLSQEQRREKMTALREQMDKKMKEILTKEQYEKWQKLREQARQRSRSRGQGAPGGGDRPNRNR